jgi:FKBP-type peptidyl-prolyl cis-trans isomerase
MMKKHLFIALSFALALGVSACKEPTVLEEIEAQEKEQNAEAEKALAQAQDYLKTNQAKAGVVTTKSGLQYEVVRKANASQPSPGPRDVVAVHYEGRLTNGEIFDSSYARNEPATFVVTEVIPGWTEALQLMKPGDEYRLTVSPMLGYGPRGKGGIPPNSVLIFKVELLGFQRAADGAVFREGASSKSTSSPPVAAAPAQPKPAAPKPAPKPPAPKPPTESDANVRFE